MPKHRATKRPRKIKRKTRKSNILIFLLLGIFSTVVLWQLIKEPIPEGKVRSEEQQVEVAKKKVTKPKKASQKHKEKPTPAKPAVAKAAKIVPAKKTVTKPAVVQDLDAAIVATLAKLDIPKSYYKKRKTADLINYNVPINKSAMDLTYANMIFKGELERAGAKLLRGTDNAGKQSLLFATASKPQKYMINLFYDAKLYETKVNPRTIAIVVDDFGSISGDLLDGFLALDKDVCFAIFPDEAYSVYTMQKAKAQGRTTIIHVPMEPIGYPNVNPGKNAILVQYDEAQINKMLNRFIHQLPDCEGINNHMGSLATTDEDIMRFVMNTLKDNNKFFLDSRTSNVSVGYSVAQKAHIRSFRNDLFLDSPNISQSTMDAKLSQIIALSATKNNIIAITHCHNNEKLIYLKRFISKLKAAGFTLVPLTEIGKYNVPELL